MPGERPGSKGKEGIVDEEGLVKRRRDHEIFNVIRMRTRRSLVEPCGLIKN